jgi:hypothetical protein
MVQAQICQSIREAEMEPLPLQGGFTCGGEVL